MSDVKLFHTLDDGDISVTQGVAELTDGSDSAVYISLFGANDDGSGWWGNSFEQQEDRQLKSEMQTLLNSGMPLIPINLRRIEDAIKRDLAWMGEIPPVKATMPALNRIQITVDNIVYNWSK